MGLFRKKRVKDEFQALKDALDSVPDPAVFDESNDEDDYGDDERKVILIKNSYRMVEEYSQGLYEQTLYENGVEVNNNVQSWPMTREEAERHIAEYEAMIGRLGDILL